MPDSPPAPETPLDDAPTLALARGRHAARNLVGQKIGSIRLTEVLGEGGMGKVYLGFDETLERKVAVKCIRTRRADSQEMRARFLQEARLLSLLRHPNICQIYDYLEGDGADFLVLELIEGRSLKQIIADGRKGDGIEENLHLPIAIALAEALSAAHARGVVHRDLKPANVMVTDAGEVKILDFGIARAMQDDLGSQAAAGRSLDETFGETRPHPAFAAEETAEPDRTRPMASSSGPRSPVHTETGSMVGTPQYMSPEQARSEPATPASDVYALGLVLQELMTGHPPYNPRLAPAMLYEAVAAGRTREIRGLAADRAALIRRLQSLDPGDRPSAPEAAAALRAIRDAPARRRIRNLKLAAVAALVLVAVVMTFQALRIRQEAEKVRRHAQNLESVLDFVVSLFEVSDPSEARGNTVTAREILDRGAEKVAAELEGTPEIRARVRHRVGTIYQHLGLYEQALGLLEGALADQELAADHGIRDEDTLADMLHAKAGVLQHLGRYEEALAVNGEALATRAELHGEEHPLYAAGLDQKGWIQARLGQYEEAESLYLRALEVRRQELGDSAEVAETLEHLASLYDEQGRLDEAESLGREALAMFEETVGDDHPAVTSALNQLAIVLDQKGLFDESADLYRRAIALRIKLLGEDSAGVASLRMNLALIHYRRGQLDEAERLFLSALPVFERVFGEDHPDVGGVSGNLAALYAKRGDFARSEQYYRRALGVFETALGPDHPAVAACNGGIGTSLSARRRYADAEPMLRAALDGFANALGPEHPEVARTLYHLAWVEAETGRLEQAEFSARDAWESTRAVHGNEHHETAKSLALLAEVERRRGHLEDAEEHLRSARGVLVETLGANVPELGGVLLSLADLHRDRGDAAQAESLYDQTAELLERAYGEEHPSWVRYYEHRAEFLDGLGRTGEATELRQHAAELAAKYGIEV